jgi:hypothetical protein
MQAKAFAAMAGPTSFETRFFETLLRMKRKSPS